MRRFFLVFCCLTAWAATSRVGLTQNPTLPEIPTVPDSLGVNIHFLDPLPGEMEMLAASGVKWVRMDMYWEVIEKEKGVYDFSAYDRLVSELDKHGLQALFILVYGNPLYDGNLSPRTDETRKAFARWATTAAQRYRGKGFLWEIWNEPNNDRFWKPKPKAKDYALLALETSRTIRQEVPGEEIIGPATSRFPFSFLETCFKAGLLEYWSGVSVHPYRLWNQPETATKGYRQLRKLIEKYAPKGKHVPILSGEWGYSSWFLGLNEKRQAKFLTRMWLVNMANGIPLSIWYDWRNDGIKRSYDHNFGLVRNTFFPDRNPPFDPKPAYQAAQAFSKHLSGFQFEKRLKIGSFDDYVFLFKRDAEYRLVAWTSSSKGHPIYLPFPQGSRSKVFDYLGKEEIERIANQSGLSLKLQDGPKFLIPLDSKSFGEWVKEKRAVPLI
jgi:hypothetical protein